MEQEVTRFFILFHTGTTLIDRPIDPCSFAGLFCCLSFVSSIPRFSPALYILKCGVPLQGYRPIVTYDYSIRTNHINAGVNGFLRGCPLFSSEYAYVRIGFSDYRSF
jgi:hypothetical protein